jgi:hypothetical protein
MTVEEILKQSGLTDEQIKALDAKVTTGLTQVLTTAASAQEKAELAQRAQQDQYDKTIAPALDTWANEKANIEAQSNYYKTLAEKAKEGGFLPGNEPFKPPAAADTTRGADGKFVAGANAVPGSPQFVETVRRELGTAFSFAADVQWRYQKLFGSVIPDSPTALITEAVANHMSPMAWAEKKYDFAKKESDITADAKKKETDAAVATALAENDKKWAEKVGSNPDVRRAETSRFSEINKAVKDGTRPDPLKMTEQERDASTRRNIQAEIAASTVQ